jgi:hypothetical protein
MAIPLLITGLCEVLFGVYGYMGVKRLDPSRLRGYILFLLFVSALTCFTSAIRCLTSEAFCVAHNCELASEGLLYLTSPMLTSLRMRVALGVFAIVLPSRYLLLQAELPNPNPDQL